MNKPPELVALYTDFGVGSHYLGQVRASLIARGVTQPIVDLCSDAPSCNPRAAAYLLASFLPFMPDNTLFMAVVDPGVGSNRKAILISADHCCFVGPDNGLLSRVVEKLKNPWVQTIELPDLTRRARTFDGRDLFAPAAALICTGRAVTGESLAVDSLIGSDWAAQLPEIIYLDAFGNGVTGLAGEGLSRNLKLMVNGVSVPYAETFSMVPVGGPFWYVNANELVEVAVNQGSAERMLGLAVGTSVAWSAG